MRASAFHQQLPTSFCLQLLAGAGAVELELSRRIDSIAEKMEGLDQYAVAQFARALDIFPKLLAENAGLKVCWPAGWRALICNAHMLLGD